MSPDPHPLPIESTSQSSAIDVLRNFLSRLPLSIFLIVLLVHVGIGAWLLSARFGMPQINQVPPIFVDLLGRDLADTQQLQDQNSSEPDETKKAQGAYIDHLADTPTPLVAAQERIPVEINLRPKPSQPLARPKVAVPRPSDLPEPIEADGKGSGAAASAAAASMASSGGTPAPLGPRVVSNIDYLGAPPSPVYPVRAKNRKQEGRVVVRVLVEASGHLRKISLLKSSGFDLLDQAAIESVGQTQFKPYSENGIPLDRLADIPIDFVLKD